ncbi:hypothetical protein [uncultured Rhodoblastus sp.]|uniref:hypothetical protein n=1 Tax=uncultured Rhodoblastus sp. TaxID=543037 RepID=UPI003144EACB
MRAEPAAFVRVQRLFKQGSEYRRVHVAPVIGRGLPQFADFLAAQRKNGATAEKLAIEFRHFPADRMGV